MCFSRTSIFHTYGQLQKLESAKKLIYGSANVTTMVNREKPFEG
jgi:hypothetical protein